MMKAMKVFVLLFMVTIYCHGQIRPVEQSYNVTVVQPSPNSAAFQKYADVPVGYYTGIPSIDIPLYTITDQELSLQLSLAYHAGGIRVSEESGPVGLGWALQGGGVISQIVRDKNDFKKFLFAPEIKEPLEKNNLIVNALFRNAGKFYGMSGAAYDYYPLVYGPESYDTERDNFSFSFGGRSGKFIINQAGQIVFDKYVDLKIEPHVADEVCDQFTITDEKGVQYLFRDAEREMTTQQITSWYLSSIKHPNGQIISFQYVSSTLTGLPQVSEVQTFGCKNARYNKTIGQARQYSALQLSRIDFRNGFVRMNYDDQRLDQAGALRMNSMEIVSTRKATPVKRFDFIYSYFNEDNNSTPTTKRLRLDQVVESGDTLKLPPYIFRYNVPADAIPKDSKAIDHWGYYNGATANTTLIPSFDGAVYNTQGGFSDYASFPGADRETNPANAQAFVLTEITYPFGGKTIFEYESNTFDEKLSRNGYYNNIESFVVEDAFEQYTINAKGNTSGTFDCSAKMFKNVTVDITFRCSSVADCQALHASSDISVTTMGLTRSLTNSNLSCNGVACTISETQALPNGIYPWQTSINTSTGFQDITLLFKWKVRKEIDPPGISATNKFNYAGGLRVKKITRQDERGTTVSARKFDYHYTDDKDNDGVLETYSYGKRMAPPSYYRYESTVEDVGSNDGSAKGCYNFARYSNSLSVLSASAQGSIVGYDNVTEYVTDINGASTLGKTVYEFENTPDLVLEYNTQIGSVENGESPVILPYRKPGLTNLGYGRNGLMKRKTDYALNNGQYVTVKETVNNYNTVEDYIYQNIAYEDYPSVQEGKQYEMQAYPAIHSEKIQLLSTVEKTPVPTTTTYTYGSTQHLLPTQIVFSRSDGQTTTIKKYYPLDNYAGLSAQAQVAKTALANLHILSPEIAVETTVGTNTEIIKKNYKVFNNIPLPESVETKQNAAAFDARYVFQNYDPQGNLLAQGKVNDFTTAYIWAYNGAYPIAEVKNALPDQIFHTSFEDDGNSTTGDSRTGTKSKTNGFVKTLSKLTPGAYTLTWWSKSPTWQLQSQIINVTGSSYTINISGQVDEVRFCPANAQMTTYTYEPLVGMASMMDVNHRLTRFIYDSLGRLTTVFDHDGNVVKKYTYNYQLR